MSKTVLINPQITINGVNLSSWCDQVALEEVYADVDDTGFGSGSKTRIAGLGDHKFTLEIQQDFAGSATEATLYPLVGTVVAISLLPLAQATSSTNPSYSFSALITQWMPLSGKLGDLEKASVSWPVSGPVTKAIA